MLTVDPYALPLPRGRDALHQSTIDKVIEYYSATGLGWSKRHNMHFGYFRFGQNPLRLEPMLQQLTTEVGRRLEVAVDKPALLLDLGCGLGAPARQLAKANRGHFVNCVTVVPCHIEQARALTEDQRLHRKVVYFLSDFTNTPFHEGIYDGAYAIESARYAQGDSKRDFLREAYRVLKPGSKLVIADGFRKDDKPMNPLLATCYDRVCADWALETFAELPAFINAMKQVGFEDIIVEEVSWRVAPSVAFIPVLTARSILLDFFNGRSRDSGLDWQQSLTPLFGLALGAARSRFGYYFINARKPH